MDYYWSHRNFLMKQRLHVDMFNKLLHLELFFFMRHMPDNLRRFLIGDE